MLVYIKMLCFLFALCRMVIKLAKIDDPLDDIIITINDEQKTIHVSANSGETDVTINK